MVKMNIALSVAWESVPLVKEFSKGLLLDGYWDNENEGFHCIFYLENEGGKLVRWIDTSQRYKYRFKGKLPNSDKFRISYHKLWDPLRFEEVFVSDVEATGNRRNPIKRKIVEKFQIRELQYFTYKQIIPGAWYALENNKLSMTEINLSQGKQIKEKLMGETFDLVNLAMQNFPILDSPVPEFNSLAFDIEVGSPRHTFAIPEKAEFPIISIGLSSTQTWTKVLVLGEDQLGDPEIEQLINEHNLNPYHSVEFFKNEINLIERFFELVMQIPILISFNGNSFDLPYILNRSKKLGISYIPVKCHRKAPLEYHFEGSIHLDLMSFFRNQAIRLYAFSGKYSTWNLDDIAEALLGKKKIVHEKWFNEMPQWELIAYNARDARITLELTQFSNGLTWTLIVLLMRLGRIPLTVLTQYSISTWIRQWLAYEHSRRNYLFPERDEIIEVKGGFESSAEIEGKGFAGAIVLDPVPGIWWDVVVIDFASLYPSTIKRRNISYETLRCKGKGHERCLTNKVPGLSHWVCLRYTGLMSSLVGFVRDLRVRWYKDLKKRSVGEKKAFYDMVQASLKVFINASYGVFGASDFDLFCPPVAESTTAFARDALLTLHKYAENEGIKVLYGDTDSLFLYQPPPSILEKIMFKMLIKHGMELGIDYNFKVLFLSDRKKNYFGFTKDGKIIIKGLQGKKSNSPKFVRQIFRQCLDVFSSIKTEKDVPKIKQQVIDQIRPIVSRLKQQSLPLEDLKTQYTLNKDFPEIRQKTPAVMIALQFFNSENGRIHEISQGSIFFGVRIKPILLHIKSNPFINLKFRGDFIEISYSDGSLVDSSQVDWEYYEETLQKTLAPILSPLNINWEIDILGQKSLVSFL